MSFFNNIKVMKDSISKTANNISNTIAVNNMEQANLARVNKEISSINSEIDSACTQIGRKFLEYVIETNEMPGIDVSDILTVLDPKMIRKTELEKELVEIQKRIKDQMIIKEKNALEEKFKKEKEKLDAALAMDIISEYEYNEKINQHRKRLDNFEAIKKIEQQYELGIISIEEKDYKIYTLINGQK
ncbi:hypothetical protein [Terrisporobacter vanillatitrophus]|uniref:hypothetical protein n=1 Tax=Terrisporobacter vanillatitrophus TaxID=3058402 RepID=UPI003367A2E5